MGMSQTFLHWRVGPLQTPPGLCALSASARSVPLCSGTSHLQGRSRTKLSSRDADDTPSEGRTGRLSRLAGNHCRGLHVARLWQLRGKYVIGFSYRNALTDYPGVPLPILGPSLLFCGKPACWVRGSNAQDKVNLPSPSPICRMGLP